MWRLLKSIFAYLLLMIFTILGAGVLFLMPSDFVVATWQSFQADAMTEGVITQSEVIRNRGRRGSSYNSSVSYTYQINGQKYESSKLAPGWIGGGKNISGHEFADKHPVGMKVDVYYNSIDPSFSLLARGWPKWSVGFSLGVWGLLIGRSFKKDGERTKRLWIGYPLTRATTLTGFLTTLFAPAIIAFEDFHLIGIFFAIMAFFASFILVIAPYAPVDDETDS